MFLQKKEEKIGGKVFLAFLDETIGKSYPYLLLVFLLCRCKGNLLN